MTGRPDRGAPVMVHAGPAQRHFDALLGLGWSRSAISRACGVPKSTISGVVGAKKVNACTADGILSVPLTMPVGTGSVDAVGARRRLQALSALGWTPGDLGRRTGYGTAGTKGVMRGQRARISRDLHDRIAALYDELRGVTPPPGLWADRAREDAARKGWLPPMALDDDRLDDLVDEPPCAPDKAELDEDDESAASHPRPAVVGMGSWQLQAACAGHPDPELWQVEIPGGSTTKQARLARERIQAAKAICATCPAIDACRDYALAHDEVGTWGGLTKSELDTLRTPRAGRVIIDWEQAEALASEGHSVRSASEALGVDRTTLRIAARREGRDDIYATLRANRRRVTPASYDVDWERAAALAEQGWGTARVAEHLGTDRYTLHRSAKHAGRGDLMERLARNSRAGATTRRWNTKKTDREEGGQS